MPPIPRVTITDVARRAGVSKGTVSVALADKPSALVVSAPTRERIRRLAKSMGYRPSLAAKGMSQRRSYLIALLGRESYFVFALETMKGINAVLHGRDYSLLAYYDGSGAADQARHLHLAQAREADGYIVAGTPETPGGANHRAVAALRKAGIPVVHLHRRIFPEVPLVAASEERAGFLATRHLLELGHRRIVHVTHSHHQDRELPGTHLDARQRAAGYAAAMREAGLRPRLLTYEPHSTHGLDYAAGLGAVAERMLAGSEPATAACCYCDYTALGLIQALQERQVRVPGQVSVIGYDGIEAGALLHPGLTTLRQPLFRIGQAAAGMVLDMLQGNRPVDAVFDPELVVRQSTAPPDPQP